MRSGATTTVPGRAGSCGSDAPAPGSVVLIDADEVTRQAVRALLEEAGHRVRACASCREAALVVEASAPDVILLMLDEPEAEACSQWQAHLQVVPGSAEIPLGVIAPNGLEVEMLLEMGRPIDSCLVEPVTRSGLGPMIEDAVRRRDARLSGAGLRELRGDQTRMWNVLLEFSRSMTRASTLETVLERIVMAAAELTCSRRVSLMLPDANNEHLVVAYAVGIDDWTKRCVRLPIGEAIAGKAFASGRRLTAAGGTDGPGAAHGYVGGSYVSMPIHATTHGGHGLSVGVLNVTHRYGDRPFEESEIEFIDMLGSIAGSVIDDTVWRQTRETLLKNERDMQVARRIQQKTVPEELPRLGGFELAAFSEPAEEACGDSYDVIGYRTEGDSIQVDDANAEHVMLMLADATGHGVGPALSVTQVRAMLRMGVRMQPELAEIVTHINEQLCEDLPRGRFICAWFGEICVKARTLRSISCGQGPILRYDAAADRVESSKADLIPLGVQSDLKIRVAPPRRMEIGDIVAVISDGVFDVEDKTGRSFGTGRAADVIYANRERSAREIMLALRRAAAEFAQGTPAADDRTAVLVKRVG